MENKRKKVLIVDDSIFARISIKKLISDSQYDLIEADNGETALKKIHSDKPDLLITDNLMPKMNGMELVSKINEENIQIPIIVISANQQEKTINKFYEMGVIGVIKKKPSKNEFNSLIEKAFQSSKEK